jgi:hypothetical protein
MRCTNPHFLPKSITYLIAQIFGLSAVDMHAMFQCIFERMGRVVILVSQVLDLSFLLFDLDSLHLLPPVSVYFCCTV